MRTGTERWKWHCGSSAGEAAGAHTENATTQSSALQLRGGGVLCVGAGGLAGALWQPPWYVRGPLKAAIHTVYGGPDVVQIADVPKPVPKADEMLVRVVAASVNRSDWEALTGTPLYARMGGLRTVQSQILGSDVAGIVEEVGPQHRDFRPGDEVFGEMESYRGGFAEFICTRGNHWARKPAALTFEQAAAIPQGGVIAFQGLRGRVKRGDTVLINGAGGAGGSFAIQIAKSYGAVVTAVDHGEKFDFMRRLGADHVIDYTNEDFARGGPRYDLILDLVAQRSPFACARALKRGGRYFAVGGPVPTLLGLAALGPLISVFHKVHPRVLVVRRNREDLERVAALCSDGTISVPVDRDYELGQTAEALRRLGEGKSRGKIVVVIRRAS